MRSIAKFLGQAVVIAASAITTLSAWAAVPTMPAGTSPGTVASPGPVQASSSVKLQWGAVSNITYYGVGVRDLVTNALVVSTTTTSPFYTASLEAGKPYRWNVAACNASGCSLYTTALYFQTAAPPNYTLSVSKSGSGTVSGSGINCGTTCSASYTSGTSVTLTAAPATGYTFGSWSGCTTVSGTSCTVSMTAAKSVSATFTISNDDHGNTTAAATLIKQNSTTAGKIEVAGDVDFFRIDVTAPGNLSVSTTGTTDTYGYLLNSAGQELVSNDNASLTDTNFSIVRIVSAGTYYVKVRHQSATGLGSYTLASTFTPLGAIPTNVVLLLHGMNSDPTTWNSLIQDKWSGRCAVIYGGRIEDTSTPSGTEACYSVRFGSIDASSKLVGIESDVTCSNISTGCRGDFTKIFDMTAGVDLGSEVAQAISAIRKRFGDNIKILLIGHSRGGLSARAALQAPKSNPDLISVIGLITTGTPHEGSPMGKIYRYLADNCIDSNKSRIKTGDCKDDWQAADTLKTSSVMKAYLDLRKPTIDFLSPLSSDIKNLKATKATLTARQIQVKKIAYNGMYLGHLGSGYSAWANNWPHGFDQFSNRSKKFALCDSLTVCTKTEFDTEFLGDGIVPFSSQSSADAGGTTNRFSSGDVYHTGEPGRLADIKEAMGSISWK